VEKCENKHINTLDRLRFIGDTEKKSDLKFEISDLRQKIEDGRMGEIKREVEKMRRAEVRGQI
jgi:hypothetical protein